jgi:molybdopterin molybdotransferase
MTVDSTIQCIARLTPLDAVLASFQSRVAAVMPRRTPLSQALGAVLAEDVQPPQCPPRPIALRDGFAVAAASIADAGPYAPVPLGLTACRVDVGGALPSGTDAVVPLDAITLRGDRAEAIAPVAPGEGVLAAGGDAAPATALRRAGERLRALDLAAMAAAGIAEVTIRSPRLALARAAAARTPVLNAAQVTLCRCAAKAGCAVSEASALAEGLSEGQCDAVIGIGGTGSGRRDDAVQELARRGRVEAHGIAICPGETAAFGFVGNRPVLLVPGRLDAALAVWLLIGRRLMAKLAASSIDEAPMTASLRRKVTSTIGMTELIPVSCSGGMAEPLGSGYLSLTALSRSDGWILVPADSEGFAAGSQVAVNQWP